MSDPLLKLSSKELIDNIWKLLCFWIDLKIATPVHGPMPTWCPLGAHCIDFDWFWVDFCRSLIVAFPITPRSTPNPDTIDLSPLTAQTLALLVRHTLRWHGVSNHFVPHMVSFQAPLHKYLPLVPNAGKGGLGSILKVLDYDNCRSFRQHLIRSSWLHDVCTGTLRIDRGMPLSRNSILGRKDMAPILCWLRLPFVLICASLLRT